MSLRTGSAIVLSVVVGVAQACAGDAVEVEPATQSAKSMTRARARAGHTASATVVYGEELELTLAIHEVQGESHLSPFAGQLVDVGPAVVTVVTAAGFFMEDRVPDANEATSNGIFVFTENAPSVSVGDDVTVHGTVFEYRPGCTPSCAEEDSAFDNLTTTEITRPSITVRSSGHALPEPASLSAAPRQMIDDDAAGSVETTGSFDPARDGIDFYEAREGMRVRLDRPSVIDPTRSFSSGTSREIGVLARPDAGPRTARGGMIIAEADFNPERILLSNAIVRDFPVVDVGDSFDGVVFGVVDYTFGNYKLLVSEPLPPVSRGGLARETTSLQPESASQLTIASLNVENLDALDPMDKFAELGRIVVGHLGSPDLLALEEVQDNDGSQDRGVVDATDTLRRFASAIQVAGGPSYVFEQIDPVDNQDGGEPGGNIRVAFMFRTDRGLTFVGRGDAGPLTANRVEVAFGLPQLAFSPGRLEPAHEAFSSSRKPLAAEFVFAERTLFVIATHFNSKGGDDPLFGRFQPPVPASEPQRIAQADQVARFVSQLLQVDPNAFVVALGDMNDFSFSPPLGILERAGLFGLSRQLPERERYTYVFQGNSQDLDHILVSESLVARARYDIVHVNAEFASQSSDHDPSIVQLEFGSLPGASVQVDQLINH